ncbi:putative esterase [alpha proteobacterium U9-1i]|nr:putative esterase [alpha proteobacterium U9-1i]
MSIDYEAEYNNRARVPEHPAIIASWSRDAEAYRAKTPPRLLRYGASPRTTIDLFEASAGASLLFIHGGYWQALDPSFFSHLARGLNERGVSVGVMGYDLCPDVRLGDIVEQARIAALTMHKITGAPIVVAGHSAGGHLAACLLATEAHVSAGYSISGVFDLAPLLSTSLNTALQLEADEADALSPIHWPAPEGRVLDAVVGGNESAEFLRQSQAMAETWGEYGVETRYEAIAGANHFTVIEPMAHADSAMCARIAELIALAKP